jgi:MFS family permease
MIELPGSAIPQPDPLRRNLPLFVCFRVLFHARFYYPVIGVLFLDLGLTLEQYALLNVVWAATIIVAEVPSGALADWWGRKRMVVLAAFLMVAEMAVFAFVPTEPVELLFWLLVVNRIISGLAEAAASGADEALAYDSLPQDEQTTRWPRVLEALMRWKSAAFIAAMLLGAAAFDRHFLERTTEMLGLPIPFPDTTRWPVYLTLGTALLAVVVALLMREPPRHAAQHAPHPWRNILAGARHVFTVRRVLLLITVGLVCDSFVRLFLTLGSNYYRLIELPEVLNGVLGAALAALGFVVAPLARRLVLRCGAVTNFSIVAGLVFLGILGLSMVWPRWGVWVLLPLGLALGGLQFFLAHYLNQWTDSSVRATVLSFRGLAFNLGYGCIGLLFALLSQRLRSENPGWNEEEILAVALVWLPGSFVFAVVVVLGTVWWKTRPRREDNAGRKLSRSG